MGGNMNGHQCGGTLDPGEALFLVGGEMRTLLVTI